MTENIPVHHTRLPICYINPPSTFFNTVHIRSRAHTPPYTITFFPRQPPSLLLLRASQSWRSSRILCKMALPSRFYGFQPANAALLCSNPGSKKDDEVMYGSGRSDDPVHSGSTNTDNTNTTSGQGTLRIRVRVAPFITDNQARQPFWR